jgi:hypothetical protein
MFRQTFDATNSGDRWFRDDQLQVEGNLVRFTVPEDVFTQDGFLVVSGDTTAIQIVECEGATKCSAINPILGILAVYICAPAQPPLPGCI